MRRFACALIAAAMLAVTAGASASADGKRFAAGVDAAVERVVLPNYAAFRDAAQRQADAMAHLCATPGADRHDAATAAFADLVTAFSRVEAIRFGPALEDYNIERLFFWPDRRSRGLKQVQGVIHTEDPTAETAATLRDKSVAVQGLLALEYVLHGTGREALLTPGPYRCRYGAALGEAIAATAADIDAGWRGSDGFAATVRDAGPDNAVFRSPAEAFQTLLKSAAEVLQIVRDLKLQASLGATPAEAKPKRAPFWRADLTLRSIAANVESAVALHDALDIPALLPPEWASEADQFAFEIGQVRQTLGRIEERGGRFVALAEDEWGHDTLTYMTIPLGGAVDILGTRYPAELGLTLGFNALDGD